MTDKKIYIPNVKRDQLDAVKQLHELHTSLRKENKELKQKLQTLAIINRDNKMLYRREIRNKNEEIKNFKKVLYDYIKEVKELKNK